MSAAVYMMSNRKRGALYIGVTDHLAERITQHKSGKTKSFTQRYSLTKLVYVEFHDTITDAIAREKQLKNWKRDWKIELIETQNPEWDDLFLQLNS